MKAAASKSTTADVSADENVDANEGADADAVEWSANIQPSRHA